MTEIRQVLVLVACATLMLGSLGAMAGQQAAGAPGPRAPQADLTVRPGSYGCAPADPTVGDELCINFTIENTGAIDCESGFTVEFFVNDTSDPFKFEENNISLGPLPKGEAWNISQYLMTNDFVSGINYTFLIVVDIKGEVNESDEDNNRLSHNQTLMPRLYPDLYIPQGAVSASPAQPEAGDDVTLNVTVGNSGEKTEKFADVFFYVNDTSHIIGAYQNIGPINVSEAKNASIVWATAGLSPGPYTLLVFVNPAWDWNRALERNYTNNNATIDITLREPIIPPPDLALRNVSCLPLEPKVGEYLVASGEVVNHGPGAAAQCNLSLFLDYVVDAASTVALPPLGPGESTNFTLAWQSTGISAIQHKLRLVADADYELADANRTDNTVNWNMTFSGALDLELRGLNITPASPRVGETVTFSVNVSNAGTLRCNSANLTLKLGGHDTDQRQLLTLAAGGWMVFALKWPTAGMAAGSYDYEIRVEPGPGENDPSPANNVLVGVAVLEPLPPGPDLRIGTVELLTPQPRAGDIVRLRMTVENAGDRDANASALMIFMETSAGSMLKFTNAPVAVQAVEAGKSAAVEVERDTLSFINGTYLLNMTVDYNGEITETNESNNHRRFELQLLPPLPKLPLLGIEDVFLDGKLEEDQKVSIVVVINNTGKADALNITVSFLIDGTLAGTRTIDVIGQGSNRSAAWDWVPSAGKHTIGVRASGEGSAVADLQRSADVPQAPSEALPYLLALGIVLLALVLGAVLYRSMGEGGRQGPRVRLLEEEEPEEDEAEDEHCTDEGRRGEDEKRPGPEKGPAKPEAKAEVKAEVKAEAKAVAKTEAKAGAKDAGKGG